MKVIFLDIDGVLNCVSTKERFDGFIGIDPEKVLTFKRLVDETGASIVLSSTWRRDEKSRDEVTRCLTEAGIPTFIDRTPHYDDAMQILGRPGSMSEYFLRGAEIHAWLSQHPDVDDYVILDDSTIVGQSLRNQYPDVADDLDARFVQTTWTEGIKGEHIDRAIQILQEGPQ